MATCAPTPSQVVTDLTMIIKAAPGGEMLIYTVDRKSGEPRGRVDVGDRKIQDSGERVRPTRTEY